MDTADRTANGFGPSGPGTTAPDTGTVVERLTPP